MGYQITNLIHISKILNQLFNQYPASSRMVFSNSLTLQSTECLALMELVNLNPINQIKWHNYNKCDEMLNDPN